MEYRQLNHQRNVAIAEDREKYWQAEAKDLESATPSVKLAMVHAPRQPW